MRCRSWIMLGVAGSLLATPFGLAAAQAAGTAVPTSRRLIVDGYISRYRLAGPGVRSRLDGMGARVMWALAPTRTPERERLAEHLALGVFFATTPSDGVTNGGEVRTDVGGIQLDVRPLREPIAGIVEPVLSLGAGVMRLEHSAPGRWSLRDPGSLRPHDLPIAPVGSLSVESRTDEMLAPAIGLSIAPRPDFALRFDVRQYRARRERATEIATGVSLRL